MASVGFDSLFTYIPLDKTINICIDNLYNGSESSPKISDLNIQTWIFLRHKKVVAYFF